jgi:TRAP-type C4-dicarboxylate transport system permease small subunit
MHRFDPSFRAQGRGPVVGGAWRQRSISFRDEILSTMMEHAADDRAGGHTQGHELRIDRLVRPVRFVFRALSLCILAAMIALPFVQIVLREFLGRPIVGAEELARFTLICLVFISLPHVIYAGANIRLEELIMMVPEGVLRGIRAVIAIVAAAVFLIGAIATAAAISSNFNTKTPTMQIPYWAFLSCVLAGFLLAAMESLILLIKIVTRAPLYVVFPSEEPGEEPFSL